MDTEKVYQLLRQFIKAAGLNNKKFAELAGINPNTFQTMVNRKSVPKADIISKINQAMSEITQHAEENKASELLRIYVPFLSIALGVEANSAVRNSFVELGSLAHDMTKFPTFDLRLMDEPPTSKQAAIRSLTLDALNKLSLEGQEEALKRIEELAFVPKYQKRDGE